MNLFNRSTKEKFVPKKYIIFNVDSFNTWWNDSDNNAMYANPGIFLRLDKLSVSHIEDYMKKAHNVDAKQWDSHDDMENFYRAIRQDWLDKIYERETKTR